MLCLDSGVSLSRGMREIPKSVMKVTSEAVADITRPLMRDPSTRLISMELSAPNAWSVQITRQMRMKARFMAGKLFEKLI